MCPTPCHHRRGIRRPPTHHRPQIEAVRPAWGAGEQGGAGAATVPIGTFVANEQQTPASIARELAWLAEGGEQNLLRSGPAVALVTGDGQIRFGAYLMGEDTPIHGRQLTGWDDLPDLDDASVSMPATHGAWPGWLLAGNRPYRSSGAPVPSPKPAEPAERVTRTADISADLGQGYALVQSNGL